MTGKTNEAEHSAMQRVYEMVKDLPTEREQNLAALTISTLGYQEKAARAKRKQRKKTKAQTA